MVVKVVKNTFDKRLDRLKKTGAMEKNEVSKDAKEEIFVQWLASNLRRFTAETYADFNGVVKSWKKFKASKRKKKTR